jgi:hypothetical protein
MKVLAMIMAASEANQAYLPVFASNIPVAPMAAPGSRHRVGIAGAHMARLSPNAPLRAAVSARAGFPMDESSVSWNISGSRQPHPPIAPARGPPRLARTTSIKCRRCTP